MKRLLTILAGLVLCAGSALAQGGGQFGNGASSGGGGGTPCTTTANSVQYNNAGAFGCISQWTSNGTTNLSGSSSAVLAVDTIKDHNSNPFLIVSPTASAVDGFTIVNAATANPATVKFQATGSDANINIEFDPKGTGSIIFCATCTNAGFYQFGQGTTNAAGTTAVTFQAPTSVTSYVASVPGAAPVNNNSAWLFSNASPSVGTFAKMPQIAITSGSAYTNATTTFSNVVGSSGQTLQFSVEASTNYVLTCQIAWQASAATAGPKFQFTGPASPTAVQYSVMQAVTATSDGTASAVAFSTSLNASGATVVTTTNEPAELNLGLVNGTNSGTVTLQAAAQGAGTLTIQPGSFCQLQ